VQRMADRHNRGITRCQVARNLKILSSISRSWRKASASYAEGPISNPNDLGPAIGRAIEVVKRANLPLLTC